MRELDEHKLNLIFWWMRTTPRAAEPGTKGDDGTIRTVPCQPGPIIPPQWDKQGTPRDGSQVQPRVQIRKVHGNETGPRSSWEVKFADQDYDHV